MAVTRTDLILEIADVCGTSRKDAKEILEAILNSMVGALRRGEPVELRRFGVFDTRKRRPRMGRNPRTGVLVEILERRVPVFKPSKELKKLLQQPSTPWEDPGGGGSSVNGAGGRFTK